MILTHNAATAAERVRARARQIHPSLTLPSGASLGDLLGSLPILSKADLAKHLPADDSWLESAVLFSETSGTTGQPLQTPRGAGDLAWNSLNQTTAYRRFVQAGADRVAILHPSVLSPFIEASSIALRELGIGQVRVYPIPRVCDYQRIFNVLERYRITTIMSTPSLVYKLLYEFSKLETGKPPRHLKKLLLTGEALSPHSTQNLQHIMGPGALVAPFVYGSSEAATLMLGRDDGLFDPVLDDFLFELHGSPDDTQHKLIVTWLRDGLMPILRYDTQDYFELAGGTTPALRFVGRAGTSSAEREVHNTIERTVYSLGEPVFHYEGTLKTGNRQLNLSAVVSSPGSRSQSTLEGLLRDALPGWQVQVQLNTDTLEFMQFSPSPKTGKLTSC